MESCFQNTLGRRASSGQYTTVPATQASRFIESTPESTAAKYSCDESFQSSSGGPCARPSKQLNAISTHIYPLQSVTFAKTSKILLLGRKNRLLGHPSPRRALPSFCVWCAIIGGHSKSFQAPTACNPKGYPSVRPKLPS